MLAGLDPSTIEFRRVLDVTWVLVIEVYGEYGLKFDEANEEMKKRLYSDEDTPQRQRAPAPKAPPDEASLAILQAAMSASDFRGPRG